MNCDAVAPECFCEFITRRLSNPRGMDLLVTPLSAKEYLVESFTEKGEAALEATEDLLHRGRATTTSRRARRWPRRSPRSRSAASTLRASPTAMQSVFKDEDFWQKHTAACIGCGVCTFLCPTCTCFDVMDDAVAGTGYRYRCWDTCQFRQFCEEASGHDRRPSSGSASASASPTSSGTRVDRFGELSCVGCGRCVQALPGEHRHLRESRRTRPQPRGARSR